MRVYIRRLTNYDEFVCVQRLHQRIWGMDEGAGIYPPLLSTASHNGGVILGAFVDNEMVGFAFGFLGIHGGEILKLCSQTMGVVTEYRHLGIGTKLKWAQRERTLSRNLSLITWTYDPLEAANACLNLHKLGAISNTYRINLYGDNFFKFGAGLPSDRLIVEWWLKSERVIKRQKAQHAINTEISIENYPCINPSTKISEFREIQTVNLAQSDQLLLCEIPADIQALKKHDMDLALDWRLKTRHALNTYFGRGYWAVDMITNKTGNEERVFYVLSSKGDFNEHQQQ